MHAVLCVDDELNILHSLKRLLRKEEYELRIANSAQEALDCMQEQHFSLVISDQRMPGMTGVELFQACKDDYPDTVRVILSGYADVAVIVDAINQGEIYRFFGKPWNDDELKASIRQCLEHYETLQENQRLLQEIQIKSQELERLNSMLSDMFIDSSMSLKLVQEIFDIVPMALLGIDDEGHLVVQNESAVDVFPQLGVTMPGTHMLEIFDPVIVSFIQPFLKSGNDCGVSPITWQGKQAEFTVRTLHFGQGARGCLVAVSPMDGKGV